MSSDEPTSTCASSASRCCGVKARNTAVSGSAARSISITATSISPAASTPCRHALLPSTYSGMEKPVASVMLSTSDVQFDLQAVGFVIARHVEHHVPARHQEQPISRARRKSRVALVSGTSSSQVTTRVAVSSSESITKSLHAWPVTSRANRSIVVIRRSCGSTPLYIHAKIQSIGNLARIASS